VVMMYVRFPLRLRNVEDLLFERGIDICHETVRHCWNRFGPMFAPDISRQRVDRMRDFRQWRWHLDEVYVKINGALHYLWRAVDHEGEALESFVTKKRDKSAALAFMKKTLKRQGKPEVIVTDGLRSYSAAMRDLGNLDRREMGRWKNNRVENSHLPFRRRERAMLRFRQMKALQKFASATPHFTTISIPNATSSTAKPTRPAARPHWPSGSRLSANEKPFGANCAKRRRVAIRLTAPPATPSTGLPLEGIRAMSRLWRASAAQAVTGARALSEGI
jgi:putative transposase